VIGLQTLLIWRSDYALTHLTQGKQKMEAVLRKNEKLAVAGRLAASISHEINNPLESISNLLYLIRTSSDPREQHTYADLAAEELRRVSQITTQTLSFYRENMSPKLAPMTPILESSVQLLRGKISTLGVKLTEEYREPLPAVVCSSGELRQVLVNLISNALDATTRGGRITIRASVSKAWTRRDRSVVRIAVADNGCGMPPAVLAKVFEPFYTTKEKTGNGLGLWVAADLIEKHGGWMKVRSRTWGSRRGTTFELVLPVGGGDGEG
jgi:signal transduction histidine kinase